MIGILDSLVEKITDKEDKIEQLKIYKSLLERVG
jgi:hypothetical protein